MRPHVLAPRPSSSCFFGLPPWGASEVSELMVHITLRLHLHTAHTTLYQEPADPEEEPLGRLLPARQKRQVEESPRDFMDGR